MGWTNKIFEFSLVGMLTYSLLTYYLLIIGLILTESNTESNLPRARLPLHQHAHPPTPPAPTYLAYLEAAGPAAFSIPFHINVTQPLPYYL